MNLEEAEIRKLETESLKNEAERDKALHEIEEISQRIKHSAFSPKGILQSVVAGIIAAGLLSVWAIGYLQPILHKKAELALLDNRILKTKNEEHTEQNKKISMSLKNERIEAKKRLQELVFQNEKLLKKQLETRNRTETLKTSLTELKKEYSQLSKAESITKEEQEEYLKRAESAENELKELHKEIQKISAAESATRARTEEAEKQLEKIKLEDTSWNLAFNERIYRIKFLPRSKVIMDLGGGTETASWEVVDQEIVWNINSITFRGKVQDNLMKGNLMEGTMTYANGKSLTWMAKRIESE